MFHSCKENCLKGLVRRNESVTIVHCSRNTLEDAETDRNDCRRKLANPKTTFRVTWETRE